MDELHLSENQPLLATKEASGEDGASNKVRLKRHITLLGACGTLIANVVGSGIFVSPVGVLQNMGSVGATLILWPVMGLYTLGQALCYAELGAVLPKAGGDYTYIYEILGEVPGFLAVYAHIFLAVTSAVGAITLTAAVYIFQPFGLDCHRSLVVPTGAFILVTFATINITNIRFGAKLGIVFAFGKLIALLAIIVTGLVYMGFGHTENFSDPWKNTITDPGKVATATLNAYFAYKGWECINTLPEEMINPKRDLFLAAIIALLTISAVYTMTNIAYFTALSPTQLLESPAVALTFMEEILGQPAGILISVAVAFSCIGTINAALASETRYLFAAGRNKHMPRFFCMLHVRFFTPLHAISVTAGAAIVYSLIPNIQSLIAYSSLAVQLKILLAMTAFFYLRWKEPHLERPVKVNAVMVAFIYLLMLVLVGFSIYQDPVTLGIGLTLFLAGVPLYYVISFLRRLQFVASFMDWLTTGIQLLTQVAPESHLHRNT